MDIGKKIRELRTANDLTLEELASRSELTKGFLSQVERNLTSPSISTLEDILEAEEEAPQGALKIAILEEDDLDIFAENQYAVKDALCLFSDVPELLEKALRLYQGRAFWDGTGDLDEAFLEEMRVRYGLVLL